MKNLHHFTKHTPSVSGRGFDVDEFRSTLQMSQLCYLDFIASQTDMETMALNYNTVTDILDRLAPPVETTRRKRKSDLWFDENCRRTKRTVRKLERRCKKTNQAHDRAAWIAALRGMMHRNFLIKRSNFWTGRIASQKNNPRKLWSSIDTLPGDSLYREDEVQCG